MARRGPAASPRRRSSRRAGRGALTISPFRRSTTSRPLFQTEIGSDAPADEAEAAALAEAHRGEHVRRSVRDGPARRRAGPARRRRTRSVPGRDVGVPSALEVVERAPRPSSGCRRRSADSDRQRHSSVPSARTWSSLPRRAPVSGRLIEPSARSTIAKSPCSVRTRTSDGDGRSPLARSFGSGDGRAASVAPRRRPVARRRALAGIRRRGDHDRDQRGGDRERDRGRRGPPEARRASPGPTSTRRARGLRTRSRQVGASSRTGGIVQPSATSWTSCGDLGVVERLTVHGSTSGGSGDVRWLLAVAAAGRRRAGVGRRARTGPGPRTAPDGRVGAGQGRADRPAADPEERADLRVVVAVVVAQDQRRADLRAESVERLVDELAPRDVVGRVGCRPVDRRRRRCGRGRAGRAAGRAGGGAGRARGGPRCRAASRAAAAGCRTGPSAPTRARTCRASRRAPRPGRAGSRRRPGRRRWRGPGTPDPRRDPARSRSRPTYGVGREFLARVGPGAGHARQAWQVAIRPPGRRSARAPARGDRPGLVRAGLGFGPSPRASRTAPSAPRSFSIQALSLSPTSRTHQASASLRLRATPASTSVSSTARSRIRRRVITGTAAVVKVWVSPPSVHAPRDVPAEPALRLVGDPHPGGPGLLAERVDPGLARRRGLGLARPLRDLDLGDGPDDEDLLAIDRHLERTREPLVGMRPANQPRSSSIVISPIASILVSCRSRRPRPASASEITRLHDYSEPRNPPSAPADRSGYRRVMPPTIRPIKADELAAWFEAFGTAFYVWPTDPQAFAEFRRPTIDYDRTIGAFEGDAIVGTFRTFPTQLTLPGGGRVAVNAVSGVSVRPTHRRRGTLSRLIADDVARATERGDVASHPHRLGVADLRPVRLRPGHLEGELDAPHAIDVVRRSSRSGRSRSSAPQRRASSCPASTPSTPRPSQARSTGRTTAGTFELGLAEWPGRPRWQGQVAIHRDDAGRAGRVRALPRRGELGRRRHAGPRDGRRRAPRGDDRRGDRPLAVPRPGGPDRRHQGREPARPASRCPGTSPTPAPRGRAGRASSCGSARWTCPACSPRAGTSATRPSSSR